MGLFKKKEKPTKPAKQEAKKTPRSNNSKNTLSDISEIAKKYNIRVSAPHGYYPEDVDKVLADLDKQLTLLSKENQMAESTINRIKDERDSLRVQLTKLKLQISMMEFPDTSSDIETAMMSRFSTIDPKAGDIPPEVPSHVEGETNLIEPVTIDTDPDDLENNSVGPEVYDDLVSKVTKSHRAKPEDVSHSEVVEPTELTVEETPEVVVQSTEEIIKQPKQKSRRHEPKTVFDLEILGGNEDA